MFRLLSFILRASTLSAEVRIPMASRLALISEREDILRDPLLISLKASMDSSSSFDARESLISVRVPRGQEEKALRSRSRLPAPLLSMNPSLALSGS